MRYINRMVVGGELCASSTTPIGLQLQRTALTQRAASSWAFYISWCNGACQVLIPRGSVQTFGASAVTKRQAIFRCGF